MCSNIYSGSINLNVKLFFNVLFCKGIVNDQTRHCRISKCNFVHEIQFLTVCFCNPRKNLKNRGWWFYYVLLPSEHISLTLLGFLIILIPCHLLQICLITSEKTENKHKDMFVQRILGSFTFSSMFFHIV